MTDLQDLLLDRLVGAKIGKGWKDGPFRLAADLIPGKPIKFTGTFKDETAKNAIASRLGYPLMLLEAAQGAASLLKAEDDRRALAMAVLRSIPPGTKQKPRPSDDYWLAGVAAVERAHRLVCRARGCQVAASLKAMLRAEDHEGWERATDALLGASCPSYTKDIDTAIRITPATPAVDRSIHAAHDCLAYGSDTAYVKQSAARAARESARAALLVGGMSEAVAVCVEIARRLGMATS
jgi:hypothetical protein